MQYTVHNNKFRKIQVIIQLNPKMSLLDFQVLITNTYKIKILSIKGQAIFVASDHVIVQYKETSNNDKTILFNFHKDNNLVKEIKY